MRLDHRHGDPDNFFGPLFTCASLGGSNSGEMVLQTVRPADPAGARGERSRQAGGDVPAGAGDDARSDAGADDRALESSEPVRKEVKGYEIDPFGKHIFKQVSLDTKRPG